MHTLIHFLQLNFLPSSASLGLLVLRVWLGLSMLLLHGVPKLTNFTELSAEFPELLGMAPKLGLTLAVFGEVVGSALLALGLLTRFAALISAATMGVAFFIVHKMTLTGELSGELAFIYLAGYVALFLCGGGKFALDSIIAQRKLAA